MLLELCLTVIVLPLAFLAPRLGDRWFTAIERYFSRFAAHRHVAVFSILILALGVRLAVLPIEPVPQPSIHDEFSYLLMSDTFAHGRLTNPAHPMWIHFETFHVNQLPTYCSKFFPAPGLFLAFGQAILGHPFWGVWLSAGLMCAAFCWAFQGWMPPGWALFGGVLAIVRLGTFSYWANSYWGGSVAAIGGALVIGALPRIKRQMRVRDALLMALGLAILASSRPYEGFFYSLPILAALTMWLLRSKKAALPILLRRIVLPMLMVLALCSIGMAYYFWRTTGSPLRPPYAAYSARYDAAPFTPWRKPGLTPIYNHAVMQQFYLGPAMDHYKFARNSPVISAMVRTLTIWVFFAGPLFSLPFLIVAWLLPYGIGLNGFPEKTRLLLAVSFISFVTLLLPTYFQLHYAAPMACAGYTLFLFCLRRVRLWGRSGLRNGRFVIRAVLLISLGLFVVRVASGHLTFLRRWTANVDDAPLTQEQIARPRAIEQLFRGDGKHLVLVRYSPDHDLDEEWVYNDASIDAARIVWAREMDIAENKQLIEYFKDRKTWLLEVDENPPRLTPYLSSSQRQPAENSPK